MVNYRVLDNNFEGENIKLSILFMWNRNLDKRLELNNFVKKIVLFRVRDRIMF